MVDVRLIDANALKATIVQNHHKEFFGSVLWNILDDMPTFDYAPVRHGEWIPIEVEARWIPNILELSVRTQYKCSVCNKKFGTLAVERPYLFCPNCGAKMDGGER